MSRDPFLMEGALDRRAFLTIGAGVFAALTVPPGLRRHTTLVRRRVPLMGTIAEVQVAHRDPTLAGAAIDAAVAELRRVEGLMTRFRADSDIGRANLGAGVRPVVVHAETALVVNEALRWADATDGRYDPALGAVVRAWDVEHRHAPPPEGIVRAFAARRLHRSVEVGRQRGAPVLVLHAPDVSIDLGAIAKGYGVDRACARLRAMGITSAIVEAGGDLYAIGSAPSGDPWRIGIQDPMDERRVIGVIAVADAAIATSGTYRQFFRHRGRRYHHLMDPDTAAPRETPVQSLTVQAQSCMQADVAATALYGMPLDRAAAVLARCAPGAGIERIV